jgi:pyridoxamine 5'-phosphate oxidase
MPDNGYINKLDYDAFRQDFVKNSLNESDLAQNPFEQFSHWFSDIAQSGMLQPNAMTLSTCSKDGSPLSRVVLLKDLDESGFVFLTNYDSQKGQHLAENPKACLLFFCMELERQIIITGTVNKTSQEESQKYFNSRPYESRVAALSSPQSQIVANRESLDTIYNTVRDTYDSNTISCPKNWGGYRLLPDSFEYWQGRANRFHDRLRYVRVNDNWKIERLAP